MLHVLHPVMRQSRMQTAAEEGLTEMTVDVADADTAVQAENAASGTETDVSTETAGSEQTEEEELGRTALWQTSTTIYMSELPQMQMQRS